MKLCFISYTAFGCNLPFQHPHPRLLPRRFLACLHFPYSTCFYGGMLCLCRFGLDLSLLGGVSLDPRNRVSSCKTRSSKVSWGSDPTTTFRLSSPSSLLIVRSLLSLFPTSHCPHVPYSFWPEMSCWQTK
ncbi:hypothetical protein IE53DRAFT_30538 [Violaceomyces palustris]|uniref:Uncharacterized protein n=1 Tax=Violaceomyces palustris TaxID=1673888 RepID=A0ACD0P1T8_9BASI|nr:hypothetical protein IE53DRAFT_30538 [Violaceomyces palustris]